MGASEQDWQGARQRFLEEHERVVPPDSARAETAPVVGPLSDEFAVLAQKLFAADTVGGVLQHVVDATRRVVPGAYLASVTMRSPEGGFTTPVFTDRLAEQIDQVQYAADEGPCLEATRADGLGMALCADLAADTEHWPTFSPEAAKLGMRSMLGIGLFPRSEPPRLGALNIYSDRPDGLDRDDREAALLLASHASIALAHTVEVSRARLEVAGLRQALESRDVIGQAKGILMERQGVDAGAAFDILRRASQDLNVKLTEIAKTLASRRSDL